MILMIIWGMSISFAACPLLGWNRYVSEVSANSFECNVLLGLTAVLHQSVGTIDIDR